jgi:hypothetical protein
MRHNVTEEVIAEVFGTSQPVSSRAITEITPLVAEATAEYRPGPKEVAAAVPRPVRPAGRVPRAIRRKYARNRRRVRRC